MSSIPIDIKILPDNDLLITWDDGHRSLFSSRVLRFLCPCAQCVDERTGKRIIDLEQVSRNVHAVKFLPVGSYALKFVWSDHHDTGLYSFEYLRSHCTCNLCKK